jgi:hypothetical protein
MFDAGVKTKWGWVVLVAALWPVAGGTPALAHPPPRPGECWVNDELLGARDCQARADADWEGLSSEEQEAIRATGLVGTEQDQLVIDYRQAKLDAGGLEGACEPRLQLGPHGHWIVVLVSVPQEPG